MSAVNLSPTWLGPGIQLLHWCNNMSSSLCCRELTLISINFGDWALEIASREYETLSTCNGKSAENRINSCLKNYTEKGGGVKAAKYLRNLQIYLRKVKHSTRFAGRTFPAAFLVRHSDVRTFVGHNCPPSLLAKRSHAICLYICRTPVPNSRSCKTLPYMPVPLPDFADQYVKFRVLV
jgi:hypothetical protein